MIVKIILAFIIFILSFVWVCKEGGEKGLRLKKDEKTTTKKIMEKRGEK